MHRVLWGMLLAARSMGACSEAPALLAVLGEPGRKGRFLVLEDGGVRVETSRAIITEWLAQPGTWEALQPDTLELGWQTPGARTISAKRRWGDVTLTATYGVGLWGSQAALTPWLFRLIRVSGTGKETVMERVCVSFITERAEEFSVRDDGTLVKGDEVHVVCSRQPDEVQSSEQVIVLAFDLQSTKGQSADLLLAVAGVPQPYGSLDVPNVRHLDASYELDRITHQWEERVGPELLVLGKRRVTEAFHAAVSTLLMEAPLAQEDQVATVLSALSRVRQGPAVQGLVRKILEDETLDKSPFGKMEADRVTALADCALYADDPERWCALLWGPLERKLSGLGSGALRNSHSAHWGLALRRASDVALMLGREARAQELRSQAARLLAAAKSPPTVETDLFSARATVAAAAKPVEPRRDNSVDERAYNKAYTLELLAKAYVELASDDAALRRNAWQTIEAILAAQPLPGVVIGAGNEDPNFAALLVWCIAEALVGSDNNRIRLLSALPAAWRDEKPMVHLQRFPTGVGPIDLEIVWERGPHADRIEMSITNVPRRATALDLYPLLGWRTHSLRTNRRQLSAQELAAGPPWHLERSVWSVTIFGEVE
ncbi:MAG: hypothetical protein ACUVX8_00205 [Candidatus Zipacnadales bacterium]